jgi:hypothetical protein
MDDDGGWDERERKIDDAMRDVMRVWWWWMVVDAFVCERRKKEIWVKSVILVDASDQRKAPRSTC